MAEKPKRRQSRPLLVRSKKEPKKTPRRYAAAVSLAGYKAFIENIDDGVYEVDLQGNFTYFNNALCQVFGFPREEIEGANFSKFMDEEHARAAFEIFNNIYRTGKGIVDLMWEIIDKEGKRRSIELSANLILTTGGEKKGFRGIARDVTQRIKAQAALKESEISLQCAYDASRAAEKRYRTLLDFVPYPMVVFTGDGKVSYLNPAFTQVFGWSLEELHGEHIPYVPADLQEQVRADIQKLLDEKMIHHHESKRLTKDGQILDVLMSGAVFSEMEGEPAGELVLLRDVTQEKKLQLTREALFRISMALPSYPHLEDLLDYVSREIRRVLDVEGALVILLDEAKKEFYFLGAAYDDRDTQKRAKEVRYPATKGVSGRVFRTGEPVIVPDTSRDPDFYAFVDDQMHFKSHSMLDVPLRSGDRIIGVLCATNKRKGVFDQSDVELLNLIASTVALSIENAQYAKEVTEAYKELASLNRAKDRAINHLSHELKTPVSVLLASLNILSRNLETLPEQSWKKTLARALRNLDRILGIQYQVEDIMADKQYRTYHLLNMLLEQCTDELETLVVQEVGEGPIVDRIRNKIEELYGPKEIRVSEFSLERFVEWRLEILRPKFPHREVEVITRFEPVPNICVPEDVLGKVVDGLIRNAIEATPDEGRIEITVHRKGEGGELIVHDYGVGITEDNQKRLFEGFFTTHDTMAYSSKRPFDFYAGGKGADLLRMKIFAERFNFKIDMESSRCGFIPKDRDLCPGRISECRFCKEREDCLESGETTFKVYFPPAPDGASCALPESAEPEEMPKKPVTSKV
jgi:PAS domain S-box-containing protein